MNFESFEDLVGEKNFDEIKIIGKDVRYMGEPSHFAAMVRKGDQAELCILMQKKDRPEPDRSQRFSRLTREQRNRDFMKDFMSFGPDLRKLQTDDICLEFLQSTGTNELQVMDLDSMMYLMRLHAAGWHLPKEHPFYKKDWAQMQMLRCQFACPCGQLPKLGDDGIKITWGSYLIRHLIEKPVRLTIEHSGQDAEPKQDREQVRISFTIRDGNRTKQKAICHIYRVTLTDPRKEQDERFADPDYRRRMLEYMSPEEYEEMRRDLDARMDEMCPRGMYYPVVEYECTQDLQLKFYTKEYLDAQPKHTGQMVTMMAKVSSERQTGPHGMRLKCDVIQEPVTSAVTELEAELFEVYENIPEREEVLAYI
ncbi:hypothetical protein C823_002600 [Eubacterium plexicaudatum ASF492]|uniref:Uncharacterized protein n=1 Tax=Eubacterium plexicaudatum ASF492 TaxID=1235802 RepID=N2A004_9FIRM|nr:hypothetical protein C823_002600 [Eubacterium plexicaudatum ASF492]